MVVGSGVVVGGSVNVGLGVAVGSGGVEGVGIESSVVEGSGVCVISVEGKVLSTGKSDKAGSVVTVFEHPFNITIINRKMKKITRLLFNRPISFSHIDLTYYSTTSAFRQEGLFNSSRHEILKVDLM